METPVPLFHSYEFDFKKGSKLQIFTKMGVFEGFVDVNPIDTGNKSCVTLHRCVKMDLKEGRQLASLNIRRFFVKDVQKIVELPVPILPCLKYQANVQIVNTKGLFDVWIEYVQQLDTVGFNVYGQGQERLRKIGWVCFFVQNDLIAIDIVTLETVCKEEELWSPILKVLRDECVHKILWNNRVIVEFMYSKFRTRVKNYMDLQSLDIEIRMHNHGKNKPKDMVWKWMSLSWLLETYMPTGVVPEELVFLKMFEDKVCVDDDRYIIRPFPVNETAKLIAITMKYLHKLNAAMKESVPASRDLKELMLFHYNTAINNDILGSVYITGHPEVVPDNMKAYIRESYKKRLPETKSET